MWLTYRLINLVKLTIAQFLNRVYYYYNADGLSAFYERTEMSIFEMLFKTEKQMAKRKSTNLNKVKNQTSFLEKHLRGTGRTISVAQAQANYGIAKLTARISELRSAGLVVKTIVNSSGNTAYRMSARDVNGSRAKMFTAN
jgi:phosphoribosylformylglycinamidine (FGAM) synthase-like amidotransferase family enzyme